MVPEDRVTIRTASRSELGLVRGVQQRAFGRVAREFGLDHDQLPPLRETVEELEKFHDDGMRFFVAVSPEGTVIGSVRAEEHNHCIEIGRLVVDDGWLRRGVATRLMAAAEEAFPEATRFELFTGAQAHDPLALYDKIGYTVFRTMHDGPVELVWLEKQGHAGLR